MINFARGHPNSSLLPVDPMKLLLRKVQEEPHLAKYLNYPPNDEGNAELLEELRLFLDRQTVHDKLPSSTTTVSTNSFFVTHGVSHALDLLCGVLSQPGDVVGVEIPTYFLVAQIFRDHGLVLQELPMKTGGLLDVRILQQELESGSRKPPNLMYIIPTHHNPTASTLSVEDRVLLAQLAVRYDIKMMCDEVYHLLDWSSSQRPARMACFNTTSASGGCLISVSSFTKIFCPGVRCGWVEGPAWVIRKLVGYGYIQSQGGCAPFIGELLTHALRVPEKGNPSILDSVLEKLCAVYQERAALLCEILLRNESPIQIAVEPQGGYFVWIQLPVPADAFAAYTLERDIKIMPGSKCRAIESDKTVDLVENYARLCFADLSLKDLKIGAERLVELLKEYMDQ